LKFGSSFCDFGKKKREEKKKEKCLLSQKKSFILKFNKEKSCEQRKGKGKGRRM